MTATAPNTLPLDIVLREAIAHHQAGRIREAEQLYRAILQALPYQAVANHNLGILACQSGQHLAGLPYLKTALTVNPAEGQFSLSYAEALVATGQVKEALSTIQIAMQRGLNTPAAKAMLQKVEAAVSNSGTTDETPAPAEINELVALFNAGRHAELEGRARQLVEKYPVSGVVWKAWGLSLHIQGKDALTASQKASKLLPDDAETHNNLGNVLHDLGQIDRAAASYHRALAIRPDFAIAHYNLGNVLQGLGKLDDAAASYHRALAITPDYADAHNNLGNVLQGLGKLDDAAASYHRALAIQPDYPEALNNLALLLNAQGKSIAALNIIKQSLRLKETDEVKEIFVASTKYLHSAHDDKDIRAAMVRALTEPWGEPTALVQFATHLVKLNSAIGGVVARAADTYPVRMSAHDLFGSNGLTSLATDPLLIALLSSTPISDIAMERFLTMARSALLETATGMMALGSEVETALSFYCALAKQCFINEYVFSYTKEEFQKASDLRDSLVAALESKTQVPVLWPVAVAAYFPLCSLTLATRLLDTQWPNTVTALLGQQVREPAEELQQRTSIPRLTNIEDAVSLLVQSQYEDSPYPRWVKAAPAWKSESIDDYLFRTFPLSSFNRLGKSGDIDILIAGCGTGKHSISTAQQFQGAKVLAIDLSMSSLSYAKRKTVELGLTSIEYAQADLLKLGSLGRSFDVIESIGVLHHLADPMVGWRLLLTLLRPGGVMQLGLYSAVARRNILRIRDFIVEQGYGSSANEIRRCRQDLVDLDKNADFGTTLKLSDFFSISTCRDLLFHVQEQCMTLANIDDFLRANNLAFLGFEIDQYAVYAYKQRFPDDRSATNLAQWQTFEKENPDTFIGMFQFWIQKVN